MNKKNSLREVREAKKMTQIEFAKKMKVSQTAISDWENGRRMPCRSNVKKIAKVFNISVTKVMELVPAFFK